MEINIEGDTLVDKIETIEGSKFHSEEGKKRLLGQILNKWRETHQLVDEAARGEGSVSGIVENLLRPYTGWRLLLPIVRGKGYNEKLEKYNLHELIGAYMFKPNSQLSFKERALNWGIDKCANPVSAALLVAGYVVGKRVLGQEGFEIKIANYTIFNLLIFNTILAGLMSGWTRYHYIKEVKKEARNLHARIQARFRG